MRSFRVERSTSHSDSVTTSILERPEALPPRPGGFRLLLFTDDRPANFHIGALHSRLLRRRARKPLVFQIQPLRPPSSGGLVLRKTRPGAAVILGESVILTDEAPTVRTAVGRSVNVGR